ncbi:MAG: hypothetical protein AAGK78_00205, partial [Planctomycetota bacterium]
MHKQLILAAAAAAVAGSAGLASGQVVTLLDRDVLNDYQYTYGGIAGGIGPAPTDGQNQLELDFSGAAAGSFPGGGSGGGQGDFVGLVGDPTVAGQDSFTITGEIEGFGGTGDYEYGAEFQFQDPENSLGITGQNPANAVIISFGLSDTAADGATAFSVTLDSSSSFARGSFADVATLLSTGELDNLNINVNAGQGTDFYGADDDAGFRLRNV